MADLFTVALGISLGAGFLTILIVVIVTRLSAPERGEKTYEAPPQPMPKPSPPPIKKEPAAEPRPFAVSMPPIKKEKTPEPVAPAKEVAEAPPKPKKKPRKAGRIERYPDCFGTKYIYETCKRDCGVVEECEKAIKILEPYS